MLAGAIGAAFVRAAADDVASHVRLELTHFEISPSIVSCSIHRVPSARGSGGCVLSGEIVQRREIQRHPPVLPRRCHTGRDH
jgi:hypothetical protein